MSRKLLAFALFATALAAVARDEPADTRVVQRATHSEAALLVLVRGTGVCTGAPITGTNLVVTAAHCILDERTGEVSTRHDLRVERDSKRYDITAVILDPIYGPEVIDGRIHPEQDAAILVMDSPIPGPGVQLHAGRVDELRAEQDVVLVGYQPVDTTGSIHRLDLGRAPARTIGDPLTHTYIGHIAASCTNRWGNVEDRDGVHALRCGMVPGGSGGPLVVRSGDRYNLVGILSSVNRSLTWNGITPVAEVRRLLADEARFSVMLPTGDTGWTPTDRGALR